MGFAALLPLIMPFFNTLIDKLFPDPEKAIEAKADLQKALNDAQVEIDKAQATEEQAQKDIITTEMTQNSWASEWRAYMMMMCISMVGWDWIIVPLANAFLNPFHLGIQAVAVPPELWTLVTVGLGGYIGKETMSNYTQAKYGAPDDDKFFAVLRQKGFNSGKLSQDQVNDIEAALKARDGE